jgi:hypothetical protein
VITKVPDLHYLDTAPFVWLKLCSYTVVLIRHTMFQIKHTRSGPGIKSHAELRVPHWPQEGPKWNKNELNFHFSCAI